MRPVGFAVLGCLLGMIAGVSQTPPKPAKASPPRQAPDLSLLRPGADPLTLHQYRGNVVALAFISTACSHCQDFTRLINPIARKYAPRGVQFLECAVDDGAAMALKGFVARFQPPFPVGWTTPESMMYFLGVTPFGDPHAMFVPHLVLLDRAGLVRGDYEPGSDFYKDPAVSVPAALEKLLKR